MTLLRAIKWIIIAACVPRSSESHVSVSVVVVMFVKCVDADSVEVLMVELHEEFITMTLGTEEVLMTGVEDFPVLAALKYRRRNAVPVGCVTLEEAALIMESVSELLEV
jgi:hypothetical protein